MENINEIIPEEFPIKDRSSQPARRKKTYFKGKKRYAAALERGYAPKPEWTRMLRGFARKTSILIKDNSTTATFKTDRGTIRRQQSSNDKMNDYTMED